MSQDSLKSQTKKGLYWKFAEQFSNYGIQFIIGIFMARMLSPEDYGITAIPAVFIAIAGIFADGGFGNALVRKPELNEKDLSTSFYYSMAIGLCCYIILFCVSPWMADFYNVPILKPLMRVTALSFLYSPIGTVQRVLLSRKLDFQTPAKISVVCRLLAAVIGIVMAYTGYGIWALVISSLVAGIIGTLITLFVVRWYPKTGWSKESFNYLWGFGNKMIGSQLLDSIYNNITPIFIGKYYTPTDLGVYNRAEGYAKMPSQNVHGVISSVTYPVLSKIQDDVDRLAYNYRRMIRVTAFIVFPLMLMLSALSRPLILIMITAKWEPCIILLQILCFSMMWWPIHAINLNLLLVLGRSDYFFKLEIIKKIYGLIILIFTLPMGLIAFCSGRILSSLISLWVNTYYTKKIINLGFWEQLNDLKHVLFLSLVMFFIVLGCTYIISNLWLQLIVGGVIGLTMYLGGAYLLKMEEIKDIKYLLKK
jgi:teichuronic acid exporter